MDETFKIYVERLRGGEPQRISESLSPNFLDVHERFLHFHDVVIVKGEAYLAEHELVIHLNITAYCKIPCSICNESVLKEITISNFYHSEPLENIRGGVFNFQEPLREAILLETPEFAECNEGKCNKRKELKKYLKNKTKGDENGFRPFADLK